MCVDLSLGFLFLVHFILPARIGSVIQRDLTVAAALKALTI